MTASILSSQIDPQLIGTLPGLINESSGLECTSEMSCWTFNDSDDNSRLFRVNSNGVFLSQVILEDADHVDYEDIARAEDGTYYIGDFGNNQNDRTDLRIYKTNDLDLAGGSIATELIQFEYSDQTQFPPDADAKNYDVEAMIHMGDSLILFSRNRTSPYDGFTKIYALSDQVGTHVAEYRGSLFGNLSSTYNSVTAADISPDGAKIVLLTRGSVFILEDFSSGIQNAQVTYNFFSFSASFEGLSFIDDCTVLLSEEADGSDAGIYSLDICDLVDDLAEYDNAQIQIKIEKGLLLLNSREPIQKVQILDGLGRLVGEFNGNNPISISHLSSGSYLVQAFSENSSFYSRFIR